MHRILMTTVVCLAAVWGAGPGIAQPSFDCLKATAPAETAICGAGTLAFLDRQMNRLYTQARGAAAPDAQEALRAHQLAFLRQRDACGADIDCIEAAYRSRFASLAAEGGLPGAYARYTMTGAAFGDMTVVRVGDTAAADILTVGDNAHTCTISFETGQATGQGAIEARLVAFEDEICTVTITPEGPSMRVNTQNCQAFCGMRAELDGLYRAAPPPR